MNNAIKRKGRLLLAAALLTLTLLLCLSACGGKDVTDEPESDLPADSTGTGSDSAATTETLDTEGKLVLALNGECKYTIVTAEFCTASESAAATRLYNKFNTLIGSAPEFKDDHLAAGESYDSAAPEILVGATDYPESQQVLNSLAYGDYAIRVIGNKLVICGASPEGTVKACNDFVSLMQRNTSKKTLLLANDLDTGGTALPFANDIPVYESEQRAMVNDLGDGCMAATVSGTDLTEVAAYQEKLVSEGYTLYDTRTLGKDNGSLYAQYTGETYTVTVLYTAYDQQARVMLEPMANTALPVKTDEEYTATGEEPVLLQIGITPSGDPVQNGCSYMVRLADGSFVVYDGGMDDTLAQSQQYDRQNARRIYEMAKQYGTPNSDGKYVIAAWIVTHGHIDHIGAFEAFVKADYETDVTVERVLCNLPSDEQIAGISDDAEMGGKMAAYRSVLRKAKEEGSILHKVHPGQVFQLRDATLEILYTYDLYSTKGIEVFNDTSVVTRLTVGGQSVMITGDLQGDGAKAMNNLYGNTMHADFLSVPHHGWFTGGTRAFYENIAPSYILWPVGDDRREEVKALSYHQYVFDNDLKVWYAGYTTTVIPLPYNGTGDVTADNTVYE